MKIFLSYGHDEYEGIARRLKRDLENEGFEIWVDKEKIKGTADWEAAIERGISTSDWLVLLMTEHSVRRPDGVCLDEVSYARFLGKNIAPIMVQEVKPPLCIARIQWIDMKNFVIPGKAFFNEEAYQQQMQELLTILRGIRKLSIEDEKNSLRYRLNPLDNDVYSEHFTKNFYGRKCLFRHYDEWLKSDKRILWLVGDAGIGKTAFVANLSTVRGDIQAVHFCRYNDNERANPKRAIMSISYYLSTQIPDYRKQLMELQDLNSLIEKSTERLFEYLVVEPMNHIDYHGGTVVIVIDALDEATVDGRNELADIIAKQFEKTPIWLKLLITSRREALLERKLAKIHPVDFSDTRYNDNLADIRGYFAEQLEEFLPKGKKTCFILDTLTAKSEGIFLYAKTIVDEIRSGNLSIENTNGFPEGLTGVYLDYFERIFDSSHEISYKHAIRPVMEVLCATCAPMPVNILRDILKIDEYDFDDICELICEMFPVKNGAMEPIHKSIIDWLVDARRSGAYRVSARRGHSQIAEYYLAMQSGKRIDQYAVRYLCIHLLGDNRIDELIKLMSDPEFFKKRVKIMGLDSTIREMLFELEELNFRDEIGVHEVFGGENFSEIFGKYRKYFYNSGLYFHLQKCGFDQFLQKSRGYTRIDGQIGIAYYYYITEKFKKAITAVEHLFSSGTTLAPVEMAELHNLQALCYRKNVDFEKAKEHFQTAREMVQKIPVYYDSSISLINLGKIAYHELDWDSADKWNRKAMFCLQEEIAIADNEDYRITLELFLAEYHRLSAECLIWNYDLQRVDEHLMQAEEIYQRVQSRDRYYIRFLYTKAFRNVLAGAFQDAFEDCELLLQQATSSYDKSQILFYRGIAALKLGYTTECATCVKKAWDYAKSIGAWLEMEEVVGLASQIGTQSVELAHSKFYGTNAIIQSWVQHAEEFIRTVPKGDVG